MVANFNNNTADKHDKAVVQASSKAVTDDRLMDFAAIEAIGSVDALEQSGWFDQYTESQRAALRALTPISRGGTGFGFEHELGWLGVVELIEQRFGRVELKAMKRQVRRYIENKRTDDFGEF